MLKLLPQEKTLKIKLLQANDTINYISDYISKYSCKEISIDISFMNIIDACYVSTVCSAKHYVKYPDGKIQWKISSDLVKELNSELELGNADYVI